MRCRKKWGSEGRGGSASVFGDTWNQPPCFFGGAGCKAGRSPPMTALAAHAADRRSC